MEPPGPSAKRCRWEEPVAGESPPRATEATGVPNPPPNPTAENPRRLILVIKRKTEEGIGDGPVDRISALPDAILGEIISLLPTKEGARTQTLATRWRHGPRRRRLACSLRPSGPRPPLPGSSLPHPPTSATLDQWLRSPALDGLQEIGFCYGELLRARQSSPPPPASTFRFSATLRVATFGCCGIPDALAESLWLPQLKHLAFESVTISEGALHAMVSRCPALEGFLLCECIGFRCARINSPSLRGICVRPPRDDPNIHQQPGELIIEDAPCLERLLYDECSGINISIISAPKLETLAYFVDYDSSTLVFGGTTFKGLLPVSLMTVLHTVKILAVNSWFIELDMIIGFMTCFPCLEKLYVKTCQSVSRNLWRRKHRNFVRSTDIRLKTVVLGKYRGIRTQVNFVSFFILNARELEVMRIEAEGPYCNLEMDKRASRRA